MNDEPEYTRYRGARERPRLDWRGLAYLVAAVVAAYGIFAFFCFAFWALFLRG